MGFLDDADMFKGLYESKAQIVTTGGYVAPPVVPSEIIGKDFPVYPDAPAVPEYTADEFEALPVKLRDAVMYQMIRDVLKIHVELKHRVDVAEAQVRNALTKENAMKMINDILGDVMGGMLGGKGLF